MTWHFDHSYARLPAALFGRALPTPVRAPTMVLFNEALAQMLGLDATALQTAEGVATLAGNLLPPGADPIAQAYAGHQFGHQAMLGDGRAILLGEHLAPSGKRVDIQLKGPGRTPYSRRGDGRAALGPMLREYIMSEAMHHLGVPTTRSLAVVATGEPVLRETALPGAVLTRVAASHLRVGTFEFAAAHRDPALLTALADYAIARHPTAPDVTDLHDALGRPVAEHPYLALLYAVIERQARLIAKWQALGFIHGVMNTDNTTISGETIDYGPCAFMDAYAPETVFSSIDHQGRYAYANQPGIGRWNLVRLAEALLPLLGAETEATVELAQTALDNFPVRFAGHWLTEARAKLGLRGLVGGADDAADLALIDALLQWMQAHRADFTNTFRALSDQSAIADPAVAFAALAATALRLAPDEQPAARAAFTSWHGVWRARLGDAQAAAAHMRAHNPAVIPRNYLVEAALAAAYQGDLAPTRDLLAALATPYAPATDPPHAAYAVLPPADPGYQTFCGT